MRHAVETTKANWKREGESGIELVITVHMFDESLSTLAELSSKRFDSMRAASKEFQP